MAETKDVCVQIPTNLNVVTKAELTSESRMELASAIAPTMEHLVAAAGMKLSAEQAAELNRAFIDRGVIAIKPGGANMSATVSVEVNSLNYTSKTSPVEAIQPGMAQVGMTRKG